MTEPTVSIAIATVATTLAILLLALRLKVHGRRPFLDLTQRWAASSNLTFGVVVTLLCAAAAHGFTRTVSTEAIPAVAMSAPDGATNKPSPHAAAVDDRSDPATAQALASLQSYANTLDGAQQSNAGAAPDAPPAALPEVNTMIAKLVARLEKQPDDVKGWKMLGWSYLNTGKPLDAAGAYERALKLDPRDDEIAKGLEEARTAQASPMSNTPATPIAIPDTNTSKAID